MKLMATSMFKGVIAIIATILIASLLLSLLLRFTSMTEESVKWVIIGCSFLALFIGGFLSGRKGKERGLILGTGTALLFSLLVFFVKYLGYHTTFSAEQYMYHGIFLVLCIIGALFGVNTSRPSS
ncbi:hypothetical protein A374_11245 [Fictibacillus macauensis ZFHKF-1]|uniref:TIGR04086 family membrane protein n=1 Tax=Fictibacillus macauensis ZFHKF-1 TaxID=1196324 RepID=I8UEH9_9BACL|nr:TIGR04086 family membrane protein [Fictibacillus macauensis]EIT85315.1 hypothetical protein A374_11245 [Fictibacillus macauensis ZFHKF-1]